VALTSSSLYDRVVGVAVAPHRQWGDDVPVVGLGERARHLDVGVRAVGQPPEDLEHEPLVEHDRRVRLLGAERADLGDVLARHRQPQQLDGEVVVARGVDDGAVLEETDEHLVAPAVVAAHDHLREVGRAGDQDRHPVDALDGAGAEPPLRRQLGGQHRLQPRWVQAAHVPPSSSHSWNQ
jgi:hypothetical protein